MIQELSDAEKAQKENQANYQKAVADWEKTVADGHAKVESDYNSALSKWNKEVADGHAKVEKEYQDALKAWESKVAEDKAKIEQEYQDALKDWESKVAEGKAQVDTKNANALKAWETQVAEGKAKVEKEYQDALTQWKAKVDAEKAKLEGDYQTELNGYNAVIDKVNKQNEDIRKQNEATKEAFKNAVAKLSTASTATKVGDNYQQTIKQTVTKGATVAITVSSKIGIEIVDVELVGPNGFKQKLNQPGTKLGSDTSNNVYHNTNDLAPGEYTLTYTFKSGANKVSDITGKFEVTTPDKVGAGSGSATFTTKAPMTTNTENQIEPLTTVHVYDYSSSYAGKVKDSLRLSKKIIEANKNPQSKHILQLYPDNYGQTSYHASGKSKLNDVKGISSKLLSKQEALDIIDKLLAINAPSEKNPTFQNYTAYFQGLADAMGAHRYVDEAATVDIPFEDIVEKITKPTDTVSVIQYTDGWMDKGKPEEMDRSFATWAKKRAKTFMSVVNRNQVTDNDTNSMRSINQMTELGHPNIYDMTGKDPKVVDNEVIKRFMETATVQVKSVKGEDQTAKITLGGDGVTVTKATLKGGSINKPLTIKDGKVDVSEKLPDGTYTVEFEATGDGALKYQIAVDGKAVVDKTTQVSGAQKGSVKTENRVDNFEPVEQGKLIPELRVQQSKPTKPEYKEPPKPVKGQYKEPEKPKPDVYVAPEKPVKGQYKEPEKPVKGQYKEPEKPVKGQYNEPEKPKQPENKRVELKEIQVATKKPELKVKDVETHTVSVKPKELPKTGDASGIASLLGLGSLGSGLLTIFGKRRKSE